MFNSHHAHEDYYTVLDKSFLTHESSTINLRNENDTSSLIPPSSEIMKILESELLKIVQLNVVMDATQCNHTEEGRVSEKPSENSNPSLRRVLMNGDIIHEIWCVGIFGSHVYGLVRDDSDLDLFVVVSNDLGEQIEEKQRAIGKRDYTYQFSTSISFENTRSKNVDFTIYSETLFNKLVNEFVLCAMEFVSILTSEHLSSFVLLKSNKMELIQTPSLISLQEKSEVKQLVRKSISYEADHSFVKAKNKMTKELNIEKGMKALFHSFRTVVFGVQIAKFGCITDFTEANHYQTEIHKTFNSSSIQTLLSDFSEKMDAAIGAQVWEVFKKVFKVKLNQLQTTFRKALMGSQQ
ncbi:hypothetical protein C9374_012684 [Naegleria lovaniensis]|uniref:Polymerase nucleotidyl transferase domain-containing protein n=1 Tax=Naegleria lovaniensis TaxID=51637 RepID=A0AA88H3J3_NAELO|nr:uncharacterized protein C9374_012684 [Naegleria lovaniensis]KAG2392432.1 hypothetical protein C9374_012684 [Naegleria lovaniensis]